jgi:hypothetical protein
MPQSEKPMPTPTINYVLYNLADGRTDVDKALAAIRDAQDEQCNGPYSQEHGGFYVIRVGENPLDRVGGEVAINIRHTIPVAGAIADHQVNGGIPDIEVALDLTGTDLLKGTEALSVSISHEVLETNGDRGANGWKTRGDGVTTDAEEMCDFVQNTGYVSTNGVWVSNFVRAAFFIPGRDGPWDYLSRMRQQYDVSNGYGITGAIGGINQIGGMLSRRGKAKQIGNLTEPQKARKRNPYSRARRRGLWV